MPGFSAAVVQMRSGIDVPANIAAMEELVREAASQGATYIQTPEMTGLVQKNRKPFIESVKTEVEDPVAPAASALAKELGITLHTGSTPVLVEESRAANRAYVFGPDGACRATYDKIHMFDVALGGGETYSESTNYAPGDRAVLTEAAGGRLGLTICYDVRFAALYRRLAKAGAQMISVPSAFTRPTGRAHWETLLRARAIETGSFILAPAQGGKHEDGRKTWGRSMVIGPWGEIVAAFDHDEPGVLHAEIDLDEVEAARSRIPSLSNDREFTGP